MALATPGYHSESKNSTKPEAAPPDSCFFCETFYKRCPTGHNRSAVISPCYYLAIEFGSRGDLGPAGPKKQKMGTPLGITLLLGQKKGKIKKKEGLKNEKMNYNKMR